eukprot:jgi/Chrzof1/14605/Cz09g09060.t1
MQGYYLSSNSCHTCIVQAKNIVIATGAMPGSLDIPGQQLCCNHNGMLDIQDRPRKLAIIGHGTHIGMAFAGTFVRFGTEVHVVSSLDVPIGEELDKEVCMTMRSV